MVNAASLADFEFLSSRSSQLSLEDVDRRDWSESPFSWILTVPSATRGAIARRLIEEWASNRGLSVHQVTDTNQRYVVINGHRVQVKLSTLWQNGTYKFQQIRNQEYEYVLCLGLSPDDIHAWLIPKDELIVHLDGVSGQHTGAGSRETYWLTVTPGGNDHWLDTFGNQLSDVYRTLSAL